MVTHEIQNIGYLKCFVGSLELKMDVLPTNLRVTHELSLHDALKIAPYTVSSGDVSSCTEPLTEQQAHLST